MKTLNGDKLELDLARVHTVRVLKDRLASMRRLPTSCQEFVVGQRVLMDSEILEDLMADTATSLLVSLIVSHEHLFTKARMGTIKEREQAIEDLAVVADHDYKRTVSVLSDCLTDRITSIKLATVDALAKVAHKGDLCAIKSLASCMTGVNTLKIEVRINAVEALGPLLDWSDAESAVTVLAPALDPVFCGSLQRATLDVIKETAPRSQHVVDFVIRVVLDTAFIATVRCLAVEVLVDVTPPEALQRIRSVLGKLANDEDQDVRISATAALNSTATDWCDSK